jgi:anti-sigma B factor antagonist
VTAADAFPARQTRFTLPRQRPSGESPLPTGGQPLRLCVRRPRPGAAVVLVRGEVDTLTAPRLTELLTSRLRGTLRTLVVDLSEVDFLGAAGLSALLYANLLARQLGVTMRVVTGDNRWAIRPLSITGVGERLTVDKTVP